MITTTPSELKKFADFMKKFTPTDFMLYNWIIWTFNSFLLYKPEHFEIATILLKLMAGFAGWMTQYLFLYLMFIIEIKRKIKREDMAVHLSTILLIIFTVICYFFDRSLKSLFA